MFPIWNTREERERGKDSVGLCNSDEFCSFSCERDKIGFSSIWLKWTIKLRWNFAWRNLTLVVTMFWKLWWILNTSLTISSSVLAMISEIPTVILIHFFTVCGKQWKEHAASESPANVPNPSPASKQEHTGRQLWRIKPEFSGADKIERTGGIHLIHHATFPYTCVALLKA